MGERSYLAIGDVLALLREEFPDVTISKIRFLESRGLLVPERTPSGYRKFYEPDVERLRWILKQQREHFLPLKVIKGRLENGMTEPAPAQPLFEMGEPPPLAPEPVLVGAPASPSWTEETGPVAVVTLAPAGPRMAAPARVASTGHGNGETRAHFGHAEDVGQRTQAVGDEPSADQPPELGPSEPGATASGEGEPAKRQRRQRPAQAESGSAGGVPAATTGEQARSSDRQDRAKQPSRSSSRPTAGVPGAAVSGASLTAGELASASGLDMAGVEELESFGLIAGRVVAGVHCYDESALVIAKLAAGFAPYGIEARHLRIFKHAADRQTGLFAQVVTPLLKQRNPEARARAIEQLSELSELGEALLRCFSQATLRELTGG